MDILKLLKAWAILLYFIISVLVLLYWFCYNNTMRKYDYSDVQEVTAIVKDVKFNFVDPKCRDEYLELETGEVITIGIGGAMPDKIGQRVTLYTDGITYEFSKEAIVDNGKNEIIGYIVIFIIFTWIFFNSIYVN